MDSESLIQACRTAATEGNSARAVREVVARAVSDPAAVVAALGEPRRSGIETIYGGPDLTVLNVVWGPGMTVPPHDHRMWAVIGIYGGREDNIFWRRLDEHPDGKLEAAGARALAVGDATSLGPDIVHSVTNPIPRLTGAIHVYGGDFFAQERSQWDPESLFEQPYSVEDTLRLFEQANARLGG